MEIDDFIQQILQRVIHDNPLLDSEIQMWDTESTSRIVDGLKAEADRHWRIDAHVSLRCGKTIIQIGEVRNNRGTVALGTMACGDALRNLQRVEEAWQTLSLAGEIYLEAGDEVGWARTRVGRMAMAVQMNA